MLSYEIYGYNSIISVILYMTINIYQLQKQLYMTIPHYIIFVVHVQLLGHITPPCLSEKHTYILFLILLYIKLIIDIYEVSL